MEEIGIGNAIALWRYPVSSVGGEALNHAHINKSGLADDRSYVILDHETQEPVNPAQKLWHPVPRLLAKLNDQLELTLSVDREHWLRFDDARLHTILSSLFGRAVSVHRYGDEVRGKAITHRYTLSPIHLISRQSIEKLQAMLPESEIDERRFRPNLVVDLPRITGGAPPEYELIGREFQIGNVRLRGVKACGRCSFTTLAQLGIPEDRAILRTLITQFDKDFGIYCEVVEEGWLHIGDPITLSRPVAMRSSIAVVGAGQSGGTVARALRELGHEGPISIFGDEGYAPYERPPLSKNFTPLDAEDKPQTSVLSSAEAKQMGVTLHLDEPIVRIDREMKVVESAAGIKHSYDILVLATGGAARRVPLLNQGYGRTHSIRTRDDARMLRLALRNAKKIFVLGGGWLGLELASTARKTSVDVALFARQTHLCAKVLPKVVAEFLAEVHLQNGVMLHLNQEPKFIEFPDRVEAHYEGRIETADLLIVAIGINANDQLARHAGLECREGVITDQNGATSDPYIYAIGDVSRQKSCDNPEGLRIESWQNAIEQAGRAARAILGVDIPPLTVPRFWSDQYDLNIQIAGMPDPQAVPEVVDGRISPFWRFKDFAIGINRPKDVHQFAVQRSTLPQPAMQVDLIRSEEVPFIHTTKYVLGNIGPIADGQFIKTFIKEVGELVIANLNGQYFGIQDQCPHAQASLSEGFLDGHRIVCPLHFAEFDLASGATHNAPKGCPQAKTYKVEIENNLFSIWLPD